jgi:hypothetical protein
MKSHKVDEVGGEVGVLNLLCAGAGELLHRTEGSFDGPRASRPEHDMIKLSWSSMGSERDLGVVVDLDRSARPTRARHYPRFRTRSRCTGGRSENRVQAKRATHIQAISSPSPLFFFSLFSHIDIVLNYHYRLLQNACICFCYCYHC